MSVPSMSPLSHLRPPVEKGIAFVTYRENHQEGTKLNFDLLLLGQDNPGVFVCMKYTFSGCLV